MTFCNSFHGVSETFHGVSETFHGVSETFHGETFHGVSETFHGVRKRFTAFHVPAENIFKNFLENVFSRARENLVQTNSQAFEICSQCMFSNKNRLKVRRFRILKLMPKIMRYV